jgi:hypothetical protein
MIIDCHTRCFRNLLLVIGSQLILTKSLGSDLAPNGTADGHSRV